MDITCGIYLYDINCGKFLIGHAARTKANNWSIPKGLKDEGEDSYKAACRELWEETNIRIEEINVLVVHPLKPVKYKKQNKVLEPFLVIIDTNLNNYPLKCHSLVNNDYPEIDKFKWANIDEMREIVHETQVENLDEVERILKKYNYPYKGK